MTEQLTWYVARSAGLVAWLAALIAVVLGLLSSTGLLGRAPTRPWLVDLHRLLSGLTVTFTAVHVVAIYLDDFVDFGTREVLVPMASSWRPGAVAWGIVAMYLLAAVELTSRLRKWIGERLWRALHWLSVALVVTATVHAVQAGTDVWNLAVLSPAMGLLVFAVGLLWWRVRWGRRSGRADGKPVRPELQTSP